MLMAGVVKVVGLRTTVPPTNLTSNASWSFQYRCPNLNSGYLPVEVAAWMSDYIPIINRGCNCLSVSAMINLSTTSWEMNGRIWFQTMILFTDSIGVTRSRWVDFENIIKNWLSICCHRIRHCNMDCWPPKRRPISLQHHSILFTPQYVTAKCAVRVLTSSIVR